ncbi:hypothetical protein [Bradyrhizobium sp. 197]|uniref:hypothetical protein n=1 Tax=Bradyrhizobium sp. 197 TaxID=2782663 RepID=UPI001FFA6364|nr:hypothetical protein [Bradyrhizobium sp. 197]
MLHPLAQQHKLDPSQAKLFKRSALFVRKTKLVPVKRIMVELRARRHHRHSKADRPRVNMMFTLRRSHDHIVVALTANRTSRSQAGLPPSLREPPHA